MKIAIINGPNLNLTGTREKDIYGNLKFDEFIPLLQKKYPNLELNYFQSNIEGEIINQIHTCGFNYAGIILNAGAYTHTSIAIADAVSSILTPVIEVHMSNVFAREEYRHVSFVGAKCQGSISGFGLKSYELAIESFILSAPIK